MFTFRNLARSTRRPLIFAAAGAVALVAVAAGWPAFSRWYYERDKAGWIPLNRGSSEAVRHRLTAWVGAQFAENASLETVILPLANNNRVAADSAAVILSHTKSVVGVWVVDSARHVVVGRRDPAPLTQLELDAAVGAAKSRRPTIVGPFLHDRTPAFSIVTPSLHGTAFVRRLNADSSIYQLADWKQQTTETSQIVILSTGGDSVVALTPLRFPAAAPGYSQRSTALPPLWRAAATGRDTAGYFRDDRGASVVASVLRIGGVDWMVIVQIDEGELMAATVSWLHVILALVLTTIALIGVGTVAVLRTLRVRRLRRTVEEDARFRAIIASSMDAILTVSIDGAIIDVNPAAADIFQASTNAMIGTRLENWLIDDVDGETPELLTALREARLQREPRLCRLRGAATDRHLEITGSATRASDGRETITVFARDVTERRRMEEAVRRTGEIALLGRVAGGLAHDFNNVILGVSGNAELIAEELGPNNPVSESLDAVLEGSQRLARLTSQLLSFGRRQMLRLDTVDLVQFFREVEPLLRAELSGADDETVRHLRIVRHVDRAVVRADRNRLLEAFLHLVGNAREAMPAWGTLTIDIDGAESSTEAAQWRIAFRDTGIGMDAATLARARQPFFSTRPRAVAQGLGLAVVEGTVEQMGGRFMLDSALGKGTVATIDLPADPTTDTRDSGAQLHVSSRPTQRGRALVVDDEAAVLRVVSRCVKLAGYDVVEASSAEQALGIVDSMAGDFQLVVSDIVMSGMDGIGLRRALLERNPALPILLISGYTGEDLARRGLAGSNAAFLEKPFVLDDLRAAITRITSHPVANRKGA